MFTVGLGQCQVTVYKTYDAIKFQKIFCDIDPSHHCNVYISATAATPWPVTTRKVQTVLTPRLRADTDLLPQASPPSTLSTSATCPTPGGATAARPATDTSASRGDQAQDLYQTNHYKCSNDGRFVRAAREINEGTASAADFDLDLPTGRVTEVVTAILEAGRISLDNSCCQVRLVYNEAKDRVVELRPVTVQ